MSKLQILLKKNKKGFFEKKTTPEKNVTTKDALVYLYRCLHIAGVHVTKKYRYAYYCYSVIINGFVTVFLPVAFMASYFVKSNKDLDYNTLFNSIQVFINVAGSSVKIWMLIAMVPRLVTAEGVLAKLDERCVSPDEVELLHTIRKLGNKLVVVFALSYWSYSTSTFITSVIAGHPPYSVYLPYINWRNSKREFLVASFIEFVLMDWCCFQEVANDAYAAVYVCILRAHINILRLRLRKLGSDPDKTVDENYEELKMCIIDHKHIIELYEIISPVIGATIFLQFAITAAILGTTLINIIIFSANYSAIMASCFYVLAVVTEICPLCYYANCLSLDSDELSGEIFHSSWMNQSPRYRQMLIFFMQRSQQTIVFMAGKIFPINLNSFISIAKFSFSLYTLIKEMGIKEKLGVE